VQACLLVDEHPILGGAPDLHSFFDVEGWRGDRVKRALNGQGSKPLKYPCLEYATCNGLVYRYYLPVI